MSRRPLFVVLLALCVSPERVFAQPPPDSVWKAVPLSAGQPAPLWFEWGLLGGYDFGAERMANRCFVDVLWRGAVPQFGLLDLAAEGSMGNRGSNGEQTVAGYLKIPYVRTGLEYNFQAEDVFFKFSMQGAVRRGGLMHAGDRIRIDYTPAQKTVQAGIMFHFPWSEYRPTRPYASFTPLPTAPPSPKPVALKDTTLARAIEQVRAAILAMDRLLTPNFGESGIFTPQGRKDFQRAVAEVKNQLNQPSGTFWEEDSAYHAGLERIFAMTTGNNDTGAELARLAESVLWRRVIVPYDRCFGQRKHPVEVTGLLPQAEAAFDEAMRARGTLEDAPRAASLDAFHRAIAGIDQAARAAKKRWDDPRLVWLPLNYGLRRSQYDSQAEMQSVIGDLVGERFTSANRVRYLLNDRFYYELRRSLVETRAYHVLWVHDYRGRNRHKEPDRVAWSQTANGYVDAFVRAIHELDRGERRALPQFYLFLDEHYYRENKSSGIITFLEHLSNGKPATIRDPEVARNVQNMVDSLHAAIEASPWLRSMDKEELQQRIRVHVSITYPYDPVFAGDLFMRDHRKLAFRDVFEDDPTSGEGLFTGEGIGEHYIGPHWEDRSLVVQGPDLVVLKAAARRLLESQGFPEEKMPLAFRERAYAPNHGALCDSLRRAGWTADIVTVMNDTGFGEKSATVLKAALYNLMGFGGLILAPDSLWTSDFWAAMFISAALRGAHVYPIAPAKENAPSDAMPTMSLLHENLVTLLRVTTLLGPEIERAGGVIRIGVYRREKDVNDVREVLDVLTKHSDRLPPAVHNFLSQPSVRDVLLAEQDSLRASYAGPVQVIEDKDDRRPSLHLKTQFFASAEAIPILVCDEWAPVLHRYFEIRRLQTTLGWEQGNDISPELMRLSDPAHPQAPTLADAMASAIEKLPPDERDRVYLFYTIGSHNQDRRSMIYDGEVLSAVGGPDAWMTLVDFAFLMAAADWPTSEGELNALYPEPGGFMRTLSRKLRNLI